MMTEYGDEFSEARAASLANRKARQEARQDADDRRASLSATKAQIRAAQGRRVEAEPDYKPESEWSTTDRQLFAAYGRKPLRSADD